MLFKITNTDKIQVKLEGVGVGLLYPKTNATALERNVMTFNVAIRFWNFYKKSGWITTFFKHFFQGGN
jgi:hypothetical protein